MWKLYSGRAAEAILRRQRERIDALCRRYGLPGPVLRAVLYQEITHIDLFDPLADFLVWTNWLRLRLLTRLSKRPIRVEKRPRSPLRKLDSSTGYAQVYAFAAIRALGFAMDRGLWPAGPRPDEDDSEDRYRVWLRLNRDCAFNLEMAVLNLLSAAEEKTGRIDFLSYGPEELKRIFTRYNGTAKQISAYGEACWKHYLRYTAEESGQSTP